MGPPSGSLTGFVSTPPQPPQPPQEVYTPPPAPIFITPSPAALRASALQAPPPIASGKSAIALYDYDATNEEEITIRENDELIVIDSSDDDWWNVRLVRSGQEGLVPKLYVELKSNSFALASGPSLAAPVAIDAQKRQDEQKIQEDQRKEDLRREEQRRDEQRREVQRREQERRGEEKRQIEADRKRAEDKARNTRMEEERRRHDEESQRKPTLLARPTQATTHAPPLPKRDDGPSQTISIPSAVPRLPERPAAPVSRPEEAKRQPTDKPNMAKVRKWVDKTGGFTVEAEFLNISEGKVHLHKVNGVKIAVPLEKLAPGEIEFIKTIPGYSSISVGGIVGVPTPGAARPRPGASSLLPASAYMYNGFDWRDWLLRAGVASTDAGEYALAFVREKLDKSVLDGVDRDVLKALGISEGDIIRIRKYAKTSISNGAGSKIAQKAKTGSSEKIDQILADEQYARQLQEQELHGNTGTTSALLKGGARGRPTGAGINSQAILAATSLLSTDRSGNSVPPAQQNINPWAGQNSNLGSNGSSTHTPTPVRQNSNSGALTAQQQLLNARQQEALNAQKQAELAAKQLYEQRAMAEQQTLLAARKAAELDQQKKQLELARMEAERNAQLQVMKNETARLEAQLAEQKKLAAMRPLQPALIPTPSGGPSLNFVPVSGRSVNAFGTQPGIMQSGNPQPQIISQQQGFQSVNAFGQQMIGGFQSQQSQNSNDKYAAFKDLDPMSQTSSVFSSSNSRSSQAFAVPQNQNFVIQQQQQQQQQLNSQVYNTNQGMLYGGGQIMQSGMSGGQQPGLMQPGFSSVNPIMAPLQPQQTGMMIGGNLTPQQLLYLQQQQQQQQQFGPR
ncbi:cytoskeletal protein binding protein [Physocladia obscura]|uniref:Actin cytoskeleton-regulatory complex protein SLA1 n=1 Tax=Physocladia obscura TaxID=109957 RepID=A0AAD5XEW1_9FUNG|nr:cytoskeletal protein binding protein [Physocladia obscura]